MRNFLSYEAGKRLLYSECLDQIEAIPLIGILGGLVRVVAAVSLIAFNAFKTVMFSIVCFGALFLGDGKVINVVRLALWDSLKGMFMPIPSIFRGIFFAPIRFLFAFCQ